MKITFTAKTFIVPREELPGLLSGYSDTDLLIVEKFARAVVAGEKWKITHLTPRGYVLSQAVGKRVLDAVLTETTNRCCL